MNSPTPEQDKSAPPATWQESMRDYLYQLRDTGTVNMMGAGPYLERDYGLTREEAKDCVLYWMKLR